MTNGKANGNEAVINAMTVDVEDYFQVSAFDDCIARSDWGRWPQRAEGNTDRVLEMLAKHGVKSTFFVLGWLGDRCPALVRRIAEGGHEIASHGYAHERLTQLTREQFRESVKRTKGLLEDITGRPVAGYRAPSYSIGTGTLWAYEELERAGYRYSSSVVPIRHDLYGMPSAPRFPFYVMGTEILEVPVTTLHLVGRNWPCGGGGYFRLVPYRCFRWGLRRVNRRERSPSVFYFHPWEIDPEQPRIPMVTLKNRVRHYLNLAGMSVKLERLLRDFAFDRMDSVFLAGIQARTYPVVDFPSLEPGARRTAATHARGDNLAA